MIAMKKETIGNQKRIINHPDRGADLAAHSGSERGKSSNSRASFVLRKSAETHPQK